MPNEKPTSAAINGRLNLEQQRKRAKELLKAAKAGEPRALERFGRLTDSTSSNPLRLADAQRVIARENGFRNWAQLKHHIQAVGFARRNVGSEGDRTLPTVHVRCGSDIRNGLRIAGFQGDFVEFADPFCIGPVAALPLQQHIHSRARFIADAFGLAEGDALGRMRAEYAALDRLGEYPRIVLWFEHDSYDQLILAYVLRHLEAVRPAARIELIVADSVPGVERFIGIGQLAPELLAWLWEQRRPLGEAHLQAGARVWEAVTAPTPEMLFQIAGAGTPALPLMAPALLRHLRELPDVGSGLGLTERLTLEIVRDHGMLPLGRAFGELTRHREPLPFLGDTMFAWVVRGLAQGATPLLSIEAGTAREPWPHQEVRLTSAGAQVLDGRLNRLDTVFDTRWVGGVEVPGKNGGTWCWDGERGCPVWRAA